MTSSNKDDVIILGIDPGTTVTGYGVIAITKKGRQVHTLDFGCIRPPREHLLSNRYHIIFTSLVELIEKHKPIEMAIETQFVHKNAQSALKLGIAQGAAILGAKEKKLSVFGYSPRAVKCAVVGTGKASKEQLQGAVARHLALKSLPTPYDAADALAIALCHSFGKNNALSHLHSYEI